MKIQTILDQIDLGSILLPKFQRGYVWNRDQVRNLMHSLYYKHPVGSLLIWVTGSEEANIRGDGAPARCIVKLLLDGQQRITSIYGIVRGKPPTFFDGNYQAFTGFYFHLNNEIFEFYAPLKMQGNPLWINVTELMQKGAGESIKEFVLNPAFQSNLTTYINRLSAVESIKDIDLHIEEVTGEEKTVDVVVDIFNRVNSGGTKLSKGDLALAKICAAWPEARDEMKNRLEKAKEAGFNFRLEWFLRCINTIATGEAFFSALEDLDIPTFQEALQKAEKAIDKLLNLISTRLGLDHDRVLGSRYSFPLLAKYLDQRGGHLGDYKERDKLLYWYIHTFLWGRYAGSTESVLNQDLNLIRDTEGDLDTLIQKLRQDRGDIRVNPDDFRGWSRGARFYPLLYMLTRVWKAKDWDTGNELSKHLLGYMSNLQLHHIFPKSLLYDRGYAISDVNAVANFTFLTQETNLLVSDRDPHEYLEEFIQKNPGSVESHWIPTDRNLWRVENYLDFLAARRELLAKAANEFLDSLVKGAIPESEMVSSIPGGVASEKEERILRECNEWVVQHGLPAGEIMYELVDPDTSELLAVLDLAWPEGIQEHYSHPVALLIDEMRDTEEAVNKMGYPHFKDPDSFRAYVCREILAVEEPVE